MNFSNPFPGIHTVNIRINRHFLCRFHNYFRFATSIYCPGGKLLENWDPDKESFIVLSSSILDVAVEKIKTCYKIVSSRHICVVSFVKLDEIKTLANKIFKKCCGILLFSTQKPVTLHNKCVLGKRFIS